MEEIKKETTFEKARPYVISTLISLSMAATSIVSKVWLDEGMSRYVLVAYGFAIGTITSTLLSLLFERNNKSKITRVVWIHVFFLGVLRTVASVTLFTALQYTSAAFAGAMMNLAPSMTFILAVLFRMEKLNIGKISSKAKIGGTLIAFGGATIMTLYKGVTVLSSHSHIHIHPKHAKALPHNNYLIGSLLLVVQCLSIAGFIILQAATMKKYPAPMKLTTLAGVSGTLIATIVAVIMDHKASSWKLYGDITIVAPLYNGIMDAGIIFYLQTLIIRTSGPVFLTSFRPATTVFTAIMGLLILGEALYLGDIIGAILISIGLYAILWGKEAEKRKNVVEPVISNQEDIVITTENQNTTEI